MCRCILKVFRRIAILFVVVALIVAMPLSAFAASASRTIPYNGYNYDCYAQCGSSTAYASTETDCASSQIRAKATVYYGSEIVQWDDSGYVYGTASVYLTGLDTHNKLVSEHYVYSVDGYVRLLTQTVYC